MIEANLEGRFQRFSSLMALPGQRTEQLDRLEELCENSIKGERLSPQIVSMSLENDWAMWRGHEGQTRI